MLLTCPICHTKLVGVFPIIIYEKKLLDVEGVHTVENKIIGYYGYCCSLRCLVRKVIFDKDLKVVHIYKYKNLDQKKKAILDALRRNYKNYSPRVKKKVLPKYRKLWNELVK